MRGYEVWCSYCYVKRGGAVSEGLLRGGTVSKGLLRGGAVRGY